ncbi:helix-turn-helix domain-containing protein [Methylovirgula sp. 4M-Z18]|uniref:helix-turn-helix domain-containing protein n=1 Tax=Methylovirgula sp. 4M-Z18 TaxID=2293567 RepID=UPI000E2F6385|nr:AraC family transcriptional regulator [Methylovirgula sp. 4M-Z18]RFB78274.1 AraC family transcriptional regulator [Methylovirgula sp. 4M-Z18]
MTQSNNKIEDVGRKARQPVLEPIVPLPSECFIWRCDDYPLPWAVWNTHPECEIHLINNAEGICYVGDHIGTFKPGDLLFVGRDLPHDWVTPLSPGETIGQRDTLIQFDEDKLLVAAEVLPELGSLKKLTRLGRRGLSFYGQARQEGAALMTMVGRAQGLERLSVFLSLLHLLSTTKEYRLLSSVDFKPNPDQAVNQVLRSAIQYLAAHFHEDVKLSDLARLAGMTETSFSRFFAKNTGNTFSRHLTEIRTAKACELLAETSRPITDICYDVGYFNLSNFNRAFRALRGMSPSRYRRLARP